MRETLGGGGGDCNGGNKHTGGVLGENDIKSNTIINN